IAFVRRVGGDSTLWLHNLADGSEQQLWDGLDRDQIEAFGTHHIYPNYDWTPDGNSLVVWAGGKIVRVPVDGSDVTDIPFSADVSVRYHEPLRSTRNPAPDTLQARMIRWPVISPDGESMAFNALGHLYWMQLPDGTPERVSEMDALEFAPSFAPDGDSLLFTSWTDENGGALHEVSWRRGSPGNIDTLYTSAAQLANPTYSADGEQILVVAGSGVSLRGQDLGAEQRHDILLINDGEAEVITSTANRGSARRITRPSFSADGERIWYFDNEGGGGERGARTPPNTAVVSVKLDGTDKRTHMKFRYAQEAIVSPDGSMVAFSELHNAYVAALPKTGSAIDFNPNSAAVAFQQFSNDGGEWMTWSADGEYLSWGFANEITRLPVDEITLGGKAKPADSGDDGILVLAVGVNADSLYTFADFSGDLEQLKTQLEGTWEGAPHVRIDATVDDSASLKAWNDLESWAGESKVGIKLVEPVADEEGDNEEEATAESGKETYTVSLEVPRARPSGTVAFTGARIITMNGDEVIDNGTVLVENNRIAAVGNVSIPDDAQVFDASGKTIMPGLIDVHAHMGYGVLDVNPQKEWRYYANLAYGVTTTHDPSASTHAVFSQAEMIEAGVMTGPRVFSTGFILYGAINTDMAVIGSYADALSHVRRLKSVGAFSVKSYMQPKREQRQWVIRAAAAEDMLVFPEGGGDFPANIGMLADGHSSIEHSLSIGQLYDDVVQLFAQTRAGYTATLLVAYGGQEGEKYFYQHDDVWKNEKLQSYFPARQIDARSRRRVMSDDDDYNHMLVAEGLKQISEAGGLVTLGAHGQLQGLGAHWELWAIASGGMETHDALRAATINGAELLGMQEHLGSIEAGKLADIIVLDDNPLADIRNTESVSVTVINGVVYDAVTMNQLWPVERERGNFHFQR
ncbi:MAG: amidohydrolase family protein, partial [Woeseiaceae bacterium]